ncbi:hypothetical protein SNEBB_009068 [Seison nebaliae]|nr:hypothetical protein SNEBB_009068 [Seison nebaliae]
MSMDVIHIKYISPYRDEYTKRFVEAMATKMFDYFAEVFRFNGGVLPTIKLKYSNTVTKYLFSKTSQMMNFARDHDRNKQPNSTFFNVYIIHSSLISFDNATLTIGRYIFLSITPHSWRNIDELDYLCKKEKVKCAILQKKVDSINNEWSALLHELGHLCFLDHQPGTMLQHCSGRLTAFHRMITEQLCEECEAIVERIQKNDTKHLVHDNCSCFMKHWDLEEIINVVRQFYLTKEQMKIIKRRIQCENKERKTFKINCQIRLSNEGRILCDINHIENVDFLQLSCLTIDKDHLFLRNYPQAQNIKFFFVDLKDLKISFQEIDMLILKALPFNGLYQTVKQVRLKKDKS